MDYKELIEQLRTTNFCQEQREQAATAIETLLAEREAAQRQGVDWTSWMQGRFERRE